MKAQDVMTTPAITIGPGVSSADARRILVDRDLSALPVVDRRGMLVGIVTESDLAGRDDRLSASEVMTPFPLYARPEDDLDRVARRITEEGIGQLPVVDHGRVVGIISRHDLEPVFVFVTRR